MQAVFLGCELALLIPPAVWRAGGARFLPQ
jgi:hypothetical protein